jgi:hypothetical protein
MPLRKRLDLFTCEEHPIGAVIRLNGHHWTITGRTERPDEAERWAYHLERSVPSAPARTDQTIARMTT